VVRFDACGSICCDLVALLRVLSTFVALIIPPLFGATCCLLSVRYVLGIVAMVFCLASWQTMNEVINNLQEQFPKPYMVTWMLHNGYLVYLVIFLPILWLIQCVRGSARSSFNFKDFLWAALFNLLIFASDYMWVLALANSAVLPALTSVSSRPVAVA